MSPATTATNISTTGKRKDAVEKPLLLLANGKEPPSDFKHSNDPTSHNLVAATKENHRVVDSEHNGSTTRSIGGEIDKTFAFLNSADGASQTTTVTEHSDPGGSDINFDPEEFRTHTSTPKSKRKLDSQSNTENLYENKDMMNVGGRSRYESSAAAGAAWGGRGYSVSGASGHHSGAKRSSSAAAATRVERDSAEMAQSSTAASSSKTSKKMSSSKLSKKRSKSASRTRSDSSISDMSAASKSSKGSAAKKVKEENKKRIKDRLTKSGHKGSITDRWQGVVNEFQDVKKLNRKGETKTTEQRKVSKIGNLDKYDNVKALFGKGLPLPMQHGPPPGTAARLRELEGETASEESTHSWTALTPMRRTTNTTLNANTGGEHRYQTRSYQQGVDAANRRGQYITGDRRIMTREGRMSSDANNIKGSRAAANSSSNVTSGQVYEKGVKFQKKKGYDIQDEASIIVDDAIRRALGLFYGGKRVSASRMGTASSRKQSSSAASRKSSAASSSSRALSEQRSKRSTTNNFIRDIKTENIYRESILKDLRGQRSMSSGGVGGVRKHSIRPIPGSGRRSEGNVLPPPVRNFGPLTPGGFYELDITPYDGQDKEKETQEQQQQPHRQYPEGTPTRFHVGGSSSHQSISLPPAQQPTNTVPGQSIQTSTSQISSSLHVNQDQRNYTQYNQNYMNGNLPFTDTPTVKTGVNPPTLTKGNVTRVLHELNQQNLARPALGQQSFRSMDSSMDADYSTNTNTWPLTKNASQTSTQYETTNSTSNISESVKLDTTGNYASLPGALSVQHGLGTQQQTPNLTVNWDMYQSGPGYSYTSHTLSPENTYSIGVDTRKGAVNRLGQRQYLYPDPLERPASTPAVLQGHNMYSPPASVGMYGAYATMPYNMSPGGGGYSHQRFYQTHYGSLGNLAQSAYQQQQHQQQPVNLHFQVQQPNQYGNRRTQSYSNIISPSSPPIRTMLQPMQQSYGSASELMDYSAYSNEPIIVADLVDKKQTGTATTTMSTQVDGGRFQAQSPGIQASSSFYSSKRSESPAVNMGKQQTLNFYVFGDRSQSETNLKAASYDIEPRYVRDDFDVSGFYYDRERQRQYDQADFYDYDDGDYQYETRSEPDYNVNRWKEMVIHHKQTQTLPPPPKRKKPPVVKRIEKKELQAYRQFPPKRFPPQVHHKETTHYITKERQIEKLPQQPPKRFSHSVQTDLSGSVVHREKPRPKVQKYSSATQYEKPPSPPRKKDTRVEVTNRVFAPRVTETRDFFRESLQAEEPEQPPQTSGKEVPISLKQSPEENVVTIIEAFNQPTTTTTVTEMTSSSRELSKPDDDSGDSEMEIIETIEVEEKEQRLSMAIFEEVEFHFERTKDGQTQVQSGKGTDLLPFQFPGKYETTVDRRKQKCTQLRECTKGGSHRYEYDANINRHLPAPNYQSAIEMKRSSEGDDDANYFDDDDENLNMRGLVEQTQEMSLQNRNYNNRRGGGRDHRNQSSHISQHVTSSSSSGFVQDDHRPSSGRHIRVIEKSQHTNIPSSSSGYSSSDTTSSAAAHQSHYSISAGGPFEMPVHDESDEHDMSEMQVYTSELKDVTLTPPEEFSPREHQENNASKNSKYISRFDPENVYFTVPEWTATNNEIFNFDKHEQSNRRQVALGIDNDSLPESLPEIASSPDIPDGKKRISKRRENHADTPKLRTRVVKDEQGNWMKITEVEKTVTRTEEFTKEDEEAARKMNASSEQLKEGEYLVMNLDEITEGQNVQEEIYAQETEDVQSSEGEEEGEYNLVDAEVLGETTITQIPVEYDEQTTTMGLKDDLDHNFDEQKYLYDMKTATLSPVITKESRSGAMFMQYGYNDMITEL